jgi:hypothetical protein
MRHCNGIQASKATGQAKCESKGTVGKVEARLEAQSQDTDLAALVVAMEIGPSVSTRWPACNGQLLRP